MVIRGVINKHAFKWMLMFQSHRHEGDSLVPTLLKRLKDESRAFAQACDAVADRTAICRIINSTIYRWCINPVQVRVEAEEALHYGSHVVLLVEDHGGPVWVYLVPVEKVFEQFGSMESFLQLNQVRLDTADPVMYPGRNKMLELFDNDAWTRYHHNTQSVVGVFVSRVVSVSL